MNGISQREPLQGCNVVQAVAASHRSCAFPPPLSLLLHARLRWWGHEVIIVGLIVVLRLSSPGCCSSSFLLLLLPCPAGRLVSVSHTRCMKRQHRPVLCCATQHIYNHRHLFVRSLTAFFELDFVARAGTVGVKNVE